MLATGTAAPSGPYHAAKCSASVHICQMRSTGASKLRSITTAFCASLASVIVFVRPSWRIGVAARHRRFVSEVRVPRS